MKTIPEINPDIPVAGQVDVLVVGGGPAGVAAALSAARLGAKVLIVEQFNCLGGVATSGAHNHISQYNAWNDRSQHIVGGVPDEIRRELIDHYLDTVEKLMPVDRAQFLEYFYGYVLIRSIQTFM